MKFDIASAAVTETSMCHDGPIWSLEVTHDRQHLLTCGQQGLEYECKMWSLKQQMTSHKYTLSDCRTARLSNAGDRIVGVKHPRTTIYSADTGQVVATLQDPYTGSLRQHQGMSYVSFSPSDELVLSDALLWDPRQTRPIHRFDRLTSYGSGRFHSNGLEVILNSEIWDLRTFKLLRLVPALDQAHVVFSACSDVIYGVMREYEKNGQSRRRDDPFRAFGTSFRTIDAKYYSLLHTTEAEMEGRRILDLCVDPLTDSIACVENAPTGDSMVRLYEVGRKRPINGDSDLDEGPDSADENSDEEDSDDDGSGGSDAMEAETEDPGPYFMSDVDEDNEDNESEDDQFMGFPGFI